MPPLCRETQSLGQQMLNAPVGINGLILICPVGVFLMAANVFGCCVSVFMCLDAVSAFLCDEARFYVYVYEDIYVYTYIYVCMYEDILQARTHTHVMCCSFVALI